MMQFIEHVTLFSVNTAKARVIQAAAAQFEHLLLEESALKALISDLRSLVDICNRYYRGAELTLHHEPGYITVRYPATGTEKFVVSIGYAPVLAHLTSHTQVREEIQRILSLKFPTDCARFLIEYTRKGGAL